MSDDTLPNFSNNTQTVIQPTVTPQSSAEQQETKKKSPFLNGFIVWLNALRIIIPIIGLGWLGMVYYSSTLPYNKSEGLYKIFLYMDTVFTIIFFLITFTVNSVLRNLAIKRNNANYPISTLTKIKSSVLLSVHTILITYMFIGSISSIHSISDFRLDLLENEIKNNRIGDELRNGTFDLDKELRQEGNPNYYLER